MRHQAVKSELKSTTGGIRQLHPHRAVGRFVYNGIAQVDTWTRKADMPTARNWFGTTAVNGKIYAIGGFGETSVGGLVVFSTVEAYDPATDTWTKKTDMPTARDVLSTIAVNGKIYAIGGAHLVRVASHFGEEAVGTAPLAVDWAVNQSLFNPERVRHALAELEAMGERSPGVKMASECGSACHRDKALVQLSQPVQSGDVDTVSVGYRCRGAGADL